MNKDELKDLYPKMPEQFLKTVDKAVSDGLKDNGKVIRMKKKILLVLAATMAMAVTAIGAGRAVMITSHSDARSEFTDAEEIGEKADEIGVDFKYVDEFENGYAFKKGWINKNNELDENRGLLRQYKDLDLVYASDKGNVHFIVEEYKGNDDTEEGEIKAYTEDYKYVPVDYEMTEQDLEDMDSGKYIFSTGDLEEEVTVCENSFVTWHEDGVSYLLMQYGDRGSLSLDEITEMAEEIMAVD